LCWETRIDPILFIIFFIHAPCSCSATNDTQVELSKIAGELSERVNSLSKSIEGLIDIEMKSYESESIQDLIDKIIVIRLILDFEVDLLSAQVKESYHDEYYKRRKLKLAAERKIIEYHLEQVENDNKSVKNEDAKKLAESSKNDMQLSIQIIDKALNILNKY
jgi:hypothetical protein